MKTVLFFSLFLLASLTACRLNFKMAGQDFSLLRDDDFVADTLLRHFDEGVYVLKICNRDTMLDGHLLSIYGNCPDAPLGGSEVDKTIYLLFFDHNRVLYYSGKTVFNTRRNVSASNDLRTHNIDLDSRNNRNKQLMRGYYSFVPPPSASRMQPAYQQITMQLEMGNGEELRMNFRREVRRDSIEPALLLQEAGISEKNEYDLFDNGPAMKPLNGIFHVNLEFVFSDTIPPSLVRGRSDNWLWPPSSDPMVDQAECVKEVMQALKW